MYSINLPVSNNYIGYIKGKNNNNIKNIEEIYKTNIELKYDEYKGTYFKIEGKYGMVLYSADKIIHLLLSAKRKKNI